MRNELKKKISFDDHIGCYGEFNIEDPICKRFCALNLRCAIERDQSTRMEVLEDLITSNSTYLKIQ